jgi:ABC-type taurine transport system substrate-binding protein
MRTLCLQLFFVAISFGYIARVLAQAPPAFPYQAVIRNADGSVYDQAPAIVRMSLRESTFDGTISYQETHEVMTNSVGLFTTAFGQGAAAIGSFAAIDWLQTAKFMQIEVDLGDGFVDIGTQQLMSVPYALVAQKALRLDTQAIPSFAGNTEALAGGLLPGDIYKTSANATLRIVY